MARVSLGVVPPGIRTEAPYDEAPAQLGYFRKPSLVMSSLTTFS